MSHLKRDRMPKNRRSLNYSMRLQTATKQYLLHITLGLYDDGRLGEIFISIAKKGSMLQTAFDAWAMMASKALQYGVPVYQVTNSFRDTKCDEGKILCEGVPAINGREAASPYDAIAMLIEAECTIDGRIPY